MGVSLHGCKSGTIRGLRGWRAERRVKALISVPSRPDRDSWHLCVHVLTVANLLYIISNELCTVDDGGNGLSPGTMSGIVGGGIVIIIVGGGMSMLVTFLFKKKRRTQSIGILLQSIKPNTSSSHNTF